MHALTDDFASVIFDLGDAQLVILLTKLNQSCFTSWQSNMKIYVDVLLVHKLYGAITCF